MHEYKPPPILFNGHLQTIYPSIFRRIDVSFYKRERINTPDGDFLDLDWSQTGCKKLVIISHGLEGSSHRCYVTGMVKAVNNSGWDALAWNFRSCGSEPNKKLQSYHNGSTNDLALVIDYAAKQNGYNEIALVGFSMGGNVTLLHLGAEAGQVNAIVSKAITFSVPMDLDSSSVTLARISNKIYMKRFLRKLHKKVKVKMEMFPGQIDDNNYNSIKSFHQFDERYTAPIHGFKNAKDYYKKCSSIFNLSNISIPTLIVNAKNDPFLSKECFPTNECKANSNITFETPQQGGHVGFPSFSNGKSYWSENRAVRFLQSNS